MGQIIIFFAGIINSLYLAPMSKNSCENNTLWFLFGIFSFFITPVLLLSWLIFDYGFGFAFNDYLIMAVIGLIYGSGIILLTTSINKIGVGIPFILSIILGAASGSLFSTLIFHKLSEISGSTWFGYSLFLITALTVSSSLMLREKEQKKNKWYVYLCFVASIFCATQGACLSYFSNEVKLLSLPKNEQFIPWSVIFIFASLAMSLYYYRRTNKPIFKLKTLLKLVIMISFYWLSVALYNYANGREAFLSEKYSWIIFMTAMMFGGNILSYCKKEWDGAPRLCHYLNLSALIMAALSSFLIQ